MKTNRHRRFDLRVAAVILAAASLTSIWLVHNASAKPKFSHGEFEVSASAGAAHTETFASPVAAFAVTWKKGSGVPTGTLRAKEDGQWTSWRPLTVDEDAGNGPWARAGSQLQFGANITEVQYILQMHGSSEVRLVALDGRDHRPLLARASSSLRDFAQRLAPSAFAQTATPVVISRADWGADESLRKKSDGTEVWPETYAPISTFIVHHTAGADGTPDLTTAKSVVRGIYQYHAVSLGWGDIGYNYLIDTAGNVFEGRYGGDGVVGGHAYRDAACSFKGPEASFNVGTVGVALLGTYQSTAPTAAMNTALANFLGWKAHDFGLDPKGSAHLVDAVYPTIIAHRDVDCTTCPGDAEYANLPSLRDAAAAFASTLPAPPTPIRAASYSAQSDTLLTAKVGQSATMWVDIRNDSNVTWRSYVVDRPQLLLTDTVPSALQHSSWPSATIAGELTTPNVAPGALGRFSLTLTAPSTAVETLAHFAVTWGGLQLSGTDFSITMRSTGLPFEGVVTNSNIPLSAFANGNRFITLFYINLGSNAWNPTDVHLAITSASGTANAFRTLSWPQSARFPITATVGPNATTKISVPIHIPNVVGVRSWAVWLERSDGTQIPGTRTTYLTRIDSRYQSQLQSETVPLALRVGWRKRVTIKLKNVGIATWGPDTVLVVREAGNASAFRDSTWPSSLGKFRPAEYSVGRGGTATFTFYLKTPRQLGVHRLEFVLASKTDPSRLYQGLVLVPIRVDP